MKKIINDKDEEIKELGEIVQQYLIPSKNYDAIIRAKDEEIERLKVQLINAFNDTGIPKYRVEKQQ